MRASLMGMVRLAVFGFLGLNLVAIGLGRMFPEGFNGRRLRMGQEIQVNTLDGSLNGSTPQFLDAESCSLRTLVLPSGDRLMNSRCAPWVDGSGQTQVVGQWTRHISERGSTSGIRTVGLARYTFPGGEPLDRIETDIYPASTPCWLPGTSARVLFTAGDGKLYRFDFEHDSSEPILPDGEARQPVKLTWKAPFPGENDVFLGDLCWGGSPIDGGRLFVSLSRQSSRNGQNVSTPYALWWLKLDSRSESILDAGPVFDGPADDEVAYRFPTVAMRSDHRAVVALLSRPEGVAAWDLVIAPLQFDPSTGNPFASCADLTTLVKGCAVTPPAFSIGGRWVSCILPHNGDLPHGIRLEVDDAKLRPRSGPKTYSVGVDPHSESLRHVRPGGAPVPTITGGSSQRAFGETRST